MLKKSKLSFHPKFTIPFLFVFALIAFWSCKKSLDDPLDRSLLKLQNSEAKTWLQDQKIAQLHQFDWSKAVTVITSKRTIIAIPLPDIGYNDKVITYSKLLIYKNDNGLLTGSVLYYIPDSEYIATTEQLSHVIDDSNNINYLKGTLLILSINGKLLLQHTDPAKSNILNLKANKSASLSPIRNDKRIAIVYGDPLASIDFHSYYPIPGGPAAPPPVGCTDYFFVTYTQTNILMVQYSGRKCGAFNILNLGLDEGATNAWIGKVSGGDSSTGGISGTNVIPSAPYMPGQDHPAINPKDYIKCFENIPDAGASYKISVQVQEPFENSDWNYGKNGVGHTAITLTKTGSNGESITQTIGFYPAANKFEGPSKIVNNGNDMDFTIQMNFDMGTNDEKFNAILNYISNPPKTYGLMGVNCTYFINEACKKGDLVLPSAWSNIAGFMDPLNVAQVMTPAGLGQSMRSLKNNNDNRIKTNPGKAPSSKGPC
jgi:hypothetical protein